MYIYLILTDTVYIDKKVCFDCIISCLGIYVSPTLLLITKVEGSRLRCFHMLCVRLKKSIVFLSKHPVLDRLYESFYMSQIADIPCPSALSSGHQYYGKHLHQFPRATPVHRCPQDSWDFLCNSFWKNKIPFNNVALLLPH